MHAYVRLCVRFFFVCLRRKEEEMRREERRGEEVDIPIPPFRSKSGLDLLRMLFSLPYSTLD